MKIEAYGRGRFPYKKSHIWEIIAHIQLPYMNTRNVFGGEHLGPIYGTSHILLPYMNIRKALKTRFHPYILSQFLNGCIFDTMVQLKISCVKNVATFLKVLIKIGNLIGNFYLIFVVKNIHYYKKSFLYSTEESSNYRTLGA